jgi:hypothetical protein
VDGEVRTILLLIQAIVEEEEEEEEASDPPRRDKGEEERERIAYVSVCLDLTRREVSSLPEPYRSVGIVSTIDTVERALDLSRDRPLFVVDTPRGTRTRSNGWESSGSRRPSAYATTTSSEGTGTFKDRTNI